MSSVETMVLLRVGPSALEKAKVRLANLENILAFREQMFYDSGKPSSEWQEAVGISLEKSRIEGFRQALEFFEDV